MFMLIPPEGFRYVSGTLKTFTRGDLDQLVQHLAGDHLANGKILPGFAINPVVSTGSNGGMTFATMAEPGTGENGIYYFGPPATAD